MRFFDGEPFEQMMALAIATMIIFASIVGYLELLASSESDVLERTAQQLAIETMGLQARGEMSLGYGYADAFRMADNLDSKAIAARDRGSDELADAYIVARNKITTLTPLLQPPYLDASIGAINTEAFESDSFYVDISLRREQFINISVIADQWEQKAQNYIAQLTILTVNLFLFGLSNTISSNSRWIFVVFGSMLTLGTLGLTIHTSLIKIQSLPDEALVAYAQADGLMLQDRYEEAVDLFTEAIEQAPDYGKAYTGRAQAYSQLDLLEEEIADYQRAIDLGIATSDVLSNLGYAYYLTGQFEEARLLAQQRIQQSNPYTLDYFDLGLLYLIEGTVDDAISAYAEGLALMQDRIATAQVSGNAVSTELSFFLDLASVDLIGLQDCLVDSQCDYQPSFAEVDINEETLATIDSVVIWLKNNLVALDYTKQLVAYNPDSQLQTLRFFDAENDLEATTFDLGITEIQVDYETIAIEAEQTLLIKVLWDGEEDILLRTLHKHRAQDLLTHIIGLGEETVYSLGDGQYEVELYVDFVLTARNSFYIEEKPPEINVISDDESQLVAEDYGFTWRYPASWMVFEEERGLYFIEPPDEDTLYILRGYNNIANDLNEIIVLFGGNFGVEPQEDRTPTMVDGQDALIFDYRIEDEDDVRARAAAVYHDGVGLIISVETVNPTLDLDNLLAEIQGGITFDS